MRLLEAYGDGRAIPADHILRENAEERGSANGERDEHGEPSSSADEQRHDDQDGEGEDDGAAPKPCDDAHRVGPSRCAVVDEPASDLGVESGRTI